jgi:hypothetical protein
LVSPRWDCCDNSGTQAQLRIHVHSAACRFDPLLHELKTEVRLSIDRLSIEAETVIVYDYSDISLIEPNPHAYLVRLRMLCRIIKRLSNDLVGQKLSQT